MLKTVQLFGRYGIEFCQQLGKSGLFLLHILFCRPRWRQAWPLLSMQLYYLGVLSLPIIVLAAIFVGMVVSLQGFHTLQKFAAENELGQLLALSIVRELGPVVTALLFAGRAGSTITAEIGLMRATHQLDAMEMMAVNPIWRVVVPRFWAGLIAMPILVLIFNLLAIYGGYLVGVLWLHVDGGAFWSNMQSAVNFRLDVFNGMIKSAVFGAVITWVAVYQGYIAEANPLGINKATTRTVVYASLLVLALDFLLTAVMMGGW